MDMEEYQELEEKHAKLQREVDRAGGALSKYMEQLEMEHGVKTLEGAQSLLRQMQNNLERKRVAYEESLKEFKTAWKSRFEGGEDAQ